MSGGDTAFYVELPADRHGNTGKRKAVVEARVVTRHGYPALVPVAPEHFVRGWPDGWRADLYNGWAEVAGPARMLDRDEYEAIIGALDASACIIGGRLG